MEKKYHPDVAVDDLTSRFHNLKSCYGSKSFFFYSSISPRQGWNNKQPGEDDLGSWIIFRRHYKTV